VGCGVDCAWQPANSNPNRIAMVMIVFIVLSPIFLCSSESLCGSN
jgi:hypothetical protein